MIKTMYSTSHSLRALALIVPLLALCSISTAIQAASPPWEGTTLDGKKCAGTRIPFGPFDYLQRDKFIAELGVVEDNHFSADVEQLIDSETAYAVQDIHYTLGAWPNHHRALQSALNYRLQHLLNWPHGAAPPPAECYLQRAIKFSPADPRPYMMYGVLLQKVKKFDEALKAYQTANRLIPNDVITQYNMGITLVALKKYKEAAQLAENVYSAGFPLPALKRKLIAAGYWNAGAGEAVANPVKQELTPAQLEAIKKAMKNLTPAQKEALEKATQEQAARKEAGEQRANPAKKELTPAQLEAIKKAMENLTPSQKEALEKTTQEQAARKEAAPVAATP